MASELWKIKILDKSEKTIRLKVYTVHPDAGEVSLHKDFALLLLTEEAYKFDENGKQVPRCSLGELIPFGESYHPENVAPYSDKVIQNVTAIEAGNIPWDYHTMIEEKEDELEAQGVEEGSDEWNRQINAYWNELHRTLEKFPYVILNIEVTDPKWIEHLDIGTTFYSAAYANDGPWVVENFSNL